MCMPTSGPEISATLVLDVHETVSSNLDRVWRFETYLVDQDHVRSANRLANLN